MGEKSSVLLIRDSYDTSDLVYRLLAQSGQYDLHTLSFDNLDTTPAKHFDLVVITPQTLLESNLEVVQKVRQALTLTPILIVTEQAKIGLYDEFLKVGRSVIFMAPFFENEFSSLVKRMARGNPLPRRSYPRHASNFLAEISIPSKNVNVTSRVKNISLGGAFLHCAFEDLKHGDVIIIRIQTGDKQRIEVSAQVRWARTHNFWGPGLGLGVEFATPLEHLPFQAHT